MSVFKVRRVLIVDDDTAYCFVLRSMLETFGYCCETASDAVEALQLIDSNSYDCVLCDIQMPKMDGLQFTRNACRDHPDLSVLIITGHSDEYTYSDAIDSGATDFIGKPICAKELDAKIKRIEKEKNTIIRLRRSSESVSREARLNESISELYRVLFTSKSMEDVCALALQYAGHLTGSNAGVAVYADLCSGDTFSCTMVEGAIGCGKKVGKENLCKKEEGIWGWVFEPQTPVLNNSPPAGSMLFQNTPVKRFISIQFHVDRDSDTTKGKTGGTAFPSDEQSQQEVQRNGLWQIAVANSMRDYDDHDLMILERVGIACSHAMRRISLEENLTILNSELRMALDDRLRLQKELEQMLGYMENILENSPDGISIVDEHGRFTLWNKAAEEVYGYTFEELKGKHAFDLYSDKSELDAMLKELRVKDGVKRYPIFMKKKDGTIAAFELSLSLLKDDTNRTLGSVGVARDITERKRAEETLLASERRFREVLENIHLLAVSLDTEGHITFCNDFFLNLTGWKREEVIGKDWFEVFVPTESRNVLRTTYLRGIALGEIKSHYEDEIASCFDKRCLIAWSATLLRDPAGKVIGATMIGRDIGEGRRMEMELRKASAEMELLIASIPSILIELSGEDRVIGWNSAAVRTFGLATDDVMGRTLRECAPKWDWKKISGSLLECRSRMAPVRADDVSFVRADGMEGLLSITVSPVINEVDSPPALILLGDDITEHRLLERQLAQAQKLESIGQLAAGIAHEINTPTQYMGDNTRFLMSAFSDLDRLVEEYGAVADAIKAGEPVDEMLRRMKDAEDEADLDYLKAEIPRAIEQSLEGVERVGKIVCAMKEFSHPGAAEKTAVDINRAIESTITVARNEWKYVADMIVDLDHTLPPVACLPGEFNQVVLNIIINAAHAIGDVVKNKENAKGTITVQTQNLGDCVKICISDTGTGIPEQIRSRIFDPFFTTKEVGRGSGQGLAIAYDVIVKKHGGRISFDTEVGNGTTFHIWLPMEAKG